MLSRIAESLFWIGRYVERSDGTARILDVHLQLLLEDPWIDEDTACRSLLSVMGTDLPPGKLVTREDVINDLAVDRQHPGSIAFAIASARENARRAREIVSTELWECLNSTNARIPKRLLPRRLTNTSAGCESVLRSPSASWTRLRATMRRGSSSLWDALSSVLI